MSAQRAGGDNEESPTASTGAGAGKTSLVSELLNIAREEGHIIGEPKLTQSEPQTEASTTETQTGEPEKEPTETTTEPEVTTETETETQTDEPAAETETETETVTAEGEEHQSIDEQIAEAEAKGEKPAWYLSRISKQTRKLAERAEEIKTVTGRADKAEQVAQSMYAEIQRLQAQVANGQTVVRPSNGDATANIWTGQGLENLAAECDRAITWAELNPDGGEMVIGKDKDGNDITRELDKKQTIGLKLAAENTKRDRIPARRNYLIDRSEMDARAVEIYPEYKDTKSQFRADAMQMLNAIVSGNIPPDIMVWIGHALKARNDYLSKNGKVESGTKKIVKSATTKVAPSTVKTSGAVPTGGKRADVDKADKELKTKGDADAGVAWLESRGIGGGGGRSSKKELVQR